MDVTVSPFVPYHWTDTKLGVEFVFTIVGGHVEIVVNRDKRGPVISVVVVVVVVVVIGVLVK